MSPSTFTPRAVPEIPNARRKEPKLQAATTWPRPWFIGTVIVGTVLLAAVFLLTPSGSTPKPSGRDTEFFGAWWE